MSRTLRSLLLTTTLLGGSALLPLSSCTGYPDPPEGGLAAGMRLVTGGLLAAGAMELGQRDAALQLSALTFPGGDCSNPVFYDGPQFDPAPRGASRNVAPFSVTVPCDQTVHLFLRRATQGAARDEVIAPLTFASYSGGPFTTQLPGLDPRYTNGPCTDTAQGQLLGRRINLGTVTLPMRTPAPALLGEGDDASLNPLKQLDSNADGVLDFDQGPTAPAAGGADGGGADGGATVDAGPTGLPPSECDSNSDGIPDVLQ